MSLSSSLRGVCAERRAERTAIPRAIPMDRDERTICVRDSVIRTHAIIYTYLGARPPPPRPRPLQSTRPRLPRSTMPYVVSVRDRLSAAWPCTSQNRNHTSSRDPSSINHTDTFASLSSLLSLPVLSSYIIDIIVLRVVRTSSSISAQRNRSPATRTGPAPAASSQTINETSRLWFS